MGHSRNCERKKNQACFTIRLRAALCKPEASEQRGQHPMPRRQPSQLVTANSIHIQMLRPLLYLVTAAKRWWPAVRLWPIGSCNLLTSSAVRGRDQPLDSYKHPDQNWCLVWLWDWVLYSHFKTVVFFIAICLCSKVILVVTPMDSQEFSNYELCKGALWCLGSSSEPLVYRAGNLAHQHEISLSLQVFLCRLYSRQLEIRKYKTGILPFIFFVPGVGLSL